MAPTPGQNSIPAVPCWRLAAVCFCLIELFAGLFLPEGLQTRAARSLMRGAVKKPAADIAIMGDSVAAGSIDPKVISAGLGGGKMSVGNYALAGSSPLYCYFQLRRLLNEGRRPSVIIYAPHPATLGLPMVDRFFGRFATVDEMFDSARHGVSLSDVVIGVASRLSYTVRYREEIRALVVDGNPGFITTARKKPVPWEGPLRTIQMPPVPSEPRDPVDFAGIMSPALRRPFHVDASVDAAIHRFLNEARQQGITVYCWILPSCESLAKLDHYQNGVREYRDYMKTMENDGLIKPLNSESQVWPDRYFFDPWHVGQYGAALQSRLLLKALESSGIAAAGGQPDARAGNY
jgi:hypothetical protein